MPKGHFRPSVLTRVFSGKKRTSLYISRDKRRSLLHPNMAQRPFFPLQSFLGRLKEKLSRKARVNTEGEYRGYVVSQIRAALYLNVHFP